MIKIDQCYTDYREDTDPKYPGGKAVNATTTESTDGTPLRAEWMNDVNGALQALFIEAFGDINKVSGKPDNVQESDVLKAIKEIIKKLLPGFASQGDYTDKHPAQGVGLVKTVNRGPNAQECQKNEPWAASPNWVYNLLTGKAADDVNKAVTEALKKRVDSGIKRMNFTEGAQYIEWDNGLKLEAVSFTIGKDWNGFHGANINFPIAFKETPLFISSFRGVHGLLGLNILEESNKLRFLLSPTSFFVTIVWNEDVFPALLNGGLIVIGV